MKIAIIGASGHYGIALDAMKIRKDIELIGVSRGHEGGNIVNVDGAKVYDDYRKLLDARPDYAIVNPRFCDASAITIEALLRGINVYSEKPLATKLEDLMAVTKALNMSKAALGGMFNYRFYPWFMAMENAVMNGDIGEVRTAHGQKSYKLGTRAEFYSHRELFGGLIPWVAVHAIDWVMRFLGDCEWVSAAHSSYGNKGNGDMEMTSATLMSFEGGKIGTVTADFLRPNGSLRHDDDRLRLTGTRGMIEAVDGHVYLENDKPKREVQLPEAKNAFIEFATAVEDGKSDDFSKPAIDATFVALSARESADLSGQRIEVLL